MTKRMSSCPLDGLEGTRGSVRQSIGDTGRVSATHPRVHGKDREVWKQPKYIRYFLSFGLFERQVMSAGVSHREVDPLDVMTEANARVALRRVTKGVPSSGNSTFAAKQNRAVQQRGRDLVPNLAHENDVTFGDQRAGELLGHLFVGRASG